MQQSGNFVPDCSFEARIFTTLFGAWTLAATYPSANGSLPKFATQVRAVLSHDAWHGEPVILAALSFRDLEYVVAIADHLHFGKAAAACAVSQPTLSAQLRKLEDYIGFDIFERTGRTVLVTSRGREIVHQARVILGEGRRLFDIVDASAEPLTGAFRLGLVATLGPYVTPLLLQPLRDTLPRLTVEMSEGLTHHLAQALESGEIDALLASSPLRGADLAELRVFRENFVLAVPRGHRLATASQVCLADVRADELMLLNEGHCLREQILALFPERRRMGRHLQAAGLESMRQMVGAGMGCALLPQLSVQVGALADDLVAYRVLGPSPPARSVSLFYRSGFGRIREVRALRDLIRDTLHATGTVAVEGRPARVCEQAAE